MIALKIQQYILLFLSSLFVLNVAAQQSNFEFIENKGQLDMHARYMGEVGNGAFFLEKNGFTVLMHHPVDLAKVMEKHHQHAAGKENKNTQAANNVSGLPPGPDGIRTENDPSLMVRSHAYKVRFEGANENIIQVPDKIQEQYNNYFIGNDPSKWASNCKIFKAVLCKNVYPGIDVRYYSDEGVLKYDIIVAPGANPDIISLNYEGADKLTVKNNELHITTSVGEVKELSPYSYQFDNANGKTEISCKFQVIDGNTVKFKLKNYNPALPLVIDPALVFSTFTGGTSNYGFTATPGPAGSLFSGSISFGAGFPLTPGAFQTGFGGGNGNGTDIGIIKFNATGSARLYATYLGGSANEYPHSIISDPQGNLVIMGRTYSNNNFPGTVKIGPRGGADLFVTKLNASGSGLIGSMVIGGSGDDGVNIEDQQSSGSSNAKISILRFYGDDSRSEVNMDAAGNIYVAAQTQSNNFPVTSGVFQSTNGGTQDGVVLKINSTCNTALFSSYLGGTGNDGAFVIDINPLTNDIYVGGATASTDFPGNKSGTWQSAYQGGSSDGYLTVIANNGSAILQTTYLGTNNYDAVYGVKFDRFGFPYVMGISEGGRWPVINATYSNPNSSQFVAKLPNNLGAPIYSTVFGTGASLPNISPVAFLVDRCENVYISGWGGALFPSSVEPDRYGWAGVRDMPTTPDALKGSGISQTDNRDLYFIVIKRNAQSLLYGSCFGQNGGDGEHVDGGTSRFDAQGIIYQAICANCQGGNGPGGPVSTPYPITPGAVGPANGGLPGGCNLGALKISFNYAGVDAGVRAVVNGVFDTSGCVPLTVTFRDTVQNAKTYEWDFDGNGTTDLVTDGIQFEAPYTYTAIGSYRLRLIAVDSTSCNIRDTSYITVNVRNDAAALAYTITKTGPCESLEYAFNNAGSAPPAGKPFKNNSFLWDFGDNTPRVPAGIGTINHTYAATGTYKTKLILVDTNYCNAPDSLEQELRVSPLVKARFETPQNGCAPYEAAFKNTSDGGQTFLWDFGDGTTSTDANPAPKTYSTPGTYIVTLTASDPFTCNKTDVASITIVLKGKPTASFTYSPLTPQENFPYTFTNTSSADAVSFKWLFGDGDSLLTNNRAPFDHQYNSNGKFTVLLIAYNNIGCSDTVPAEVTNIVVPKLDVPNAFTPAGPNNNIIYIRGFAIGKMRWRIYNRFGNLVFESNSRNLGWDGKYKGVILPMDVYAYTLEVEFTDGVRTSKKGDITLLR
jgi:gliding motility-associated-like protein